MINKQLEGEDETNSFSDKEEIQNLHRAAKLSLSLHPHLTDPFEAYIKDLKARFEEKNPQAFRSRFIKGYQVLLERLKNDQDTPPLS